MKWPRACAHYRPPLAISPLAGIVLNSFHLRQQRTPAVPSLPPASSPSSRALRVRKPIPFGDDAARLPSAGVRSTLAPDSLAESLLLAAHVIAAVRSGHSLTVALRALGPAEPAARAAAQDVAYGSLRRYGCGEFILRHLLNRTLPHAETEALLLAALYRLHTRPDVAYTVVDQAVSAAGELAGAFRGLVGTPCCVTTCASVMPCMSPWPTTRTRRTSTPPGGWRVCGGPIPIVGGSRRGRQ